MSEATTPRLMAAAKEFNIGKETLVDFLAGKGFSRDDLKPTSRLTEEMYRALQAEFSSDKAAKAKSDQIEIPKGNILEQKRKKDEEEIHFKKDVKKKETVAAVEAPSEPEVEVPQEVAPEKPAIKEPEVVRVDVPELEGPKIVDKIDLEALETSTRPRQKKEEAPEPVKKEEVPLAKTEEEAPVIEKAELPQEPVKTETVETGTPVEVRAEMPEESQEAGTGTPVVENIRAERLEGPKIIGKIQLPPPGEQRARPGGDEKKQRKRIPIQKRGEPVRPDTQGQNRGGGQGRPGDNRGGRPGDNRGGQRGGPGQNRGPGGGRGQERKREDREIDAREIQEKIRQTQAKLSGGGGKGKSAKAKMRRARREELAEQLANDAAADNKLQVTEFVTVSELASLMDVNFTEVITKCMNLGIMVSINQRLDAEVIELVASEFGFEVEFIGLEDQEDEEDYNEEDDLEDNESRPPIVTIMGHVDHGKTSLLDYIRNANVVAGEAGGITQHIGAYEVTLPNGKAITFLDTPGHEAFTAMRARGAKVTDIAVIVIAADDAVMPQTKEAISHAQAAGVPMIFAINKVDKDGANPEKIKEQLAGMNLLVEDWGGKFQSQELSAKKGMNVDLLLEKILLEAELLELKANSERQAVGTVIEASLDKGRGFVATILVQNGTLRQGDLIVSGQYYGRAKAMFNERNQRIEEAGPSTPVVLLGLNGAPQAGEKFRVFEDESEAKEVANRRAQIIREQGIRARKHITLDEIGRRLALGNFKELNVIIKGDVDGSVEALSDSLQKLSTPEIAVNVVLKGVGQITESDVLLATASDAIIIGFNVRPSSQANKLAENEGVEIKLYSIIYNAIEEVKSAMEGMLEPTVTEKVVANVEVREVYRFDKATVAGCYVTEGKLYRNSKIRLIREGIVIYPVGEGATAELGSLKRFKDDVKEVVSGMECGLTMKNYNDVRVGDVIEAYEIEEVKRTL